MKFEIHRIIFRNDWPASQTLAHPAPRAQVDRRSPINGLLTNAA
jgi:hypothetical protein